MYSPLIVDRRLHQIQKELDAKGDSLRLMRMPRDRSIEISTRLEQLRRGPNGQIMADKALVRALDDKEKAFIRSERIMCKADFSYYLTRYHTIERDPGVGTESGNGPAKLLESQEYLIKRLGQREEVCHAEQKKYGRTAGILAYCHKVRQVAFTATLAGAKIHRMLFWPGTRAFSATLKDGPAGTGELYKRDLLAIQNLPFWLQPEIYPNVKDEEIGFAEPLNCRMSYQAENQQTGIGTGTQQDVSHLTEVPLWSYPHRIRYSFIPSIPKAISTLHVQEGTSSGKSGYWNDVSEGCRNKREGFEDYIYIFVGWYRNRTKYVSNPPDGWIPSENTVKQALLVERTSPEFCEGETIHPSREQLYWWEKTRALHVHNGELSVFKANFACNPEESFVNWAAGALPVELIDEMQYDVRPPRPYEVCISI